MSNERKRLELKRETIRHLDDFELLGVYGGASIGCGSTNLKTTKTGKLQLGNLADGPDDGDVRQPRLPPTYNTLTVPGKPTPRPQPQPHPVVTSASYYCG
jgi:hypothetical protein